MDDIGKTFADAVANQIKLLDQNAFAVEKIGGLPVDSIRSVIRSDSKRAVPRITRAKEICDLLGLEFYIGPPRDTVGAEQPLAADPEEFAHIPLHEASLAAGAGAANGAEPIVDYLSFRRDWLRRIGVAPANAVLARVVGDSMEPTIWCGDMVLIDVTKKVPPVRTNKTKKGRSPIYAVLDDGQARVKRIERPVEDQIMLLSDNPDFSPEFAKNETLTIIGKVMWWGHTNRD
jgi:SOS-response transcriptional repressor LexA